VVSRAVTNQRLAVLARIDLPDAFGSGLAARSLRITPFSHRSDGDKLRNWARFAADNPDTFVGVYQFWIQRPIAH
jgi:hypothetical protein